MRSQASRAKEFNFIMSFLDNQDKFLNHLNSNKNGGVYNEKSISIEWGKIINLFDYIKVNNKKVKYKLEKPLYFYHLDNLKKKRKEEIEINNNLKKGSITKKAKTDILIISNNKPIYISYKDSKVKSKLGQISAETYYGKAMLKGGRGSIKRSDFSIPKIFNYENTDLKKDKFDKLTKINRDYAYIKYNYWDEWKIKVDKVNNEKDMMLKNFVRTICNDKNSFIQFLSRTLIGNNKAEEYHFIIIDDKLISLKKFFTFLKNKNYTLFSKQHKTSNKKSYIIGLRINNVNYCITKIEPTFDGWQNGKSQTKGVIYYFQDFSIENKNWINLIKDFS